MNLQPHHLARLPGCAAILAAKGADSPYAADCAVRAYRGRHLSDLCRDLGLLEDSPSDVVIIAGIGRLTMTPSGNRFDAAGAVAQAAMPLPAPMELAARRRGMCEACAHLTATRCTVAGCTCTGLGRPQIRASRCPLGKW